MRIIRSSLVVFLVLSFSSIVRPLAAATVESTLANDDFASGDTLGASSFITTGETYAATFTADPSLYPYTIKSVQVLMVNNPTTPGTACGLFYLSIWEDDGAMDPVLPPLVESELSGDISFEFAAQTDVLQELNLTQGGLEPPTIAAGSVRVGLRAAMNMCILTYSNGKYPILAVDGAVTSGVNYIYGGVEPGVVAWHDAADEGITGDFLMRLVVTTESGGGQDVVIVPDVVEVVDIPEPEEEVVVPEVVEVAPTPEVMEVVAVPDAAEVAGVEVGGELAEDSQTSDKGGGVGVPVEISAVYPSSAPNDEVTPVVITGLGFVEGLTVKLGSYPLTVGVVNTSSIESVVPVGLSAGSYDVTVVLPSGLKATLEEGFTVTDASSDVAPDATSSETLKSGEDSGCGAGTPTGAPWWVLMLCSAALLLLGRARQARGDG